MNNQLFKKYNFLSFKKIFFFISLTTLYSQNPLNVSITDECSDLSSIYTFNNVLNGKNQYSFSYFDTEEQQNITVYIGFDGIKWVLYAFDILNYGFYNPQVPNSLLPPFTGWIPTQCEIGTLTISEVLSTTSNEFSSITISPNPTMDYIYLSFSNLELNYELFDVTGKIVAKNSIINNSIDLSNLDNGYYFLILKHNENKVIKKIVKI
ncbi:MAG: T9SS type A sorting domain-containing protein [Flavobacteriales bacterium]|jgi:hypothetical protein|nr:T9SS type A sorting domain-containing protein [Flavobacteriales bacterium]